MQERWKKFAELESHEFRRELSNVAGSITALLMNKRASYGPHNLTKFGDVGILIRTSDKLERLVHMHGEGMTTTPVGEDALDAWRDIAGYALLVLVAHSLDEDRALNADEARRRAIEAAAACRNALAGDAA